MSEKQTSDIRAARKRAAAASLNTVQMTGKVDTHANRLRAMLANWTTENRSANVAFKLVRSLLKAANLPAADDDIYALTEMSFEGTTGLQNLGDYITGTHAAYEKPVVEIVMKMAIEADVKEGHADNTTKSSTRLAELKKAVREAVASKDKEKQLKLLEEIASLGDEE